MASGPISLGDVQAFIQYSRQFTQPITQLASHGEPAAVRRRVGGARVRAARRRRAGARPGRRRCSPTSRRGPGRVRARGVPLPARQAADPGPVAVAAAGPDGRDRRPDRRGQDHAGQPAHAVLRGRRRADHPRRRRRPRHDPRRTALEIGMVLQDTWLFGGTIRDNIAYGAAGRHPGGDRRGGRGDPRRPLRAHAARRLRHGGRRRGRATSRPARSSSSPSPGRSSPTRRSSSSTRRRARWTPAPRCWCSRR